MKKNRIFEHTDELYDHLMKAYDIAGGLRDVFSEAEINQGKLKEHCNIIRGKIYELRELRGKFKELINQLP
jgi:hypothetical protein